MQLADSVPSQMMSQPDWGAQLPIELWYRVCAMQRRQCEAAQQQQDGEAMSSGSSPCEGDSWIQTTMDSWVSWCRLIASMTATCRTLQRAPSP